MNRFVSLWDETIIIILPFLMIGLMEGFIHLPVIAVFFFLIFFSMNRLELCISMLLLFPPLLGTIFRYLNINVPGSIIPVFLVLLLLRMNVLEALYQKSQAILFSATVLGIFIFYYFITAKTEYSDRKIMELCLNSVIYLIVFSLIASSPDIDVRRIGRTFFLYGLLLVSFGIDILGYQQFSGLFDFTTFRETSMAFIKLQETVGISSHSVGIAGMTGLAFLISSPKNGKLDYYLIPAFIWLILISGARQALVAVLFVFFLKYVLYYRKNFMSGLTLWIVMIMFGGVLYLADVEAINSVIDSNSSLNTRLNRNYDYAFMMLGQHFEKGIGFGNYYNSWTNEVYPHNIILEILCEMGFFGFLILSVVVLIFISKNEISIRKQLICGSFAIIVYVPYLVRSMISDSIGHNISIFIILFTLYSGKTSKVLKSIYKSRLKWERKKY